MRYENDTLAMSPSNYQQYLSDLDSERGARRFCEDPMEEKLKNPRPNKGKRY